jgi:hypothetical protein
LLSLNLEIVGVDGAPLVRGLGRLPDRLACNNVVRSSREESDSEPSSSELLTTRPVGGLFDTGGFGGDMGISYVSQLGAGENKLEVLPRSPAVDSAEVTVARGAENAGCGKFGGGWKVL